MSTQCDASFRFLAHKEALFTHKIHFKEEIDLSFGEIKKIIVIDEKQKNFNHDSLVMTLDANHDGIARVMQFLWTVSVKLEYSSNQL